MTRLAKTILDQILIFVILYQHAENLFISYVHSLDKVNFRVLSPDWPHPYLTMPTPNIFNHCLICVKLYQHTKNHLTPSVHSSERVNFKLFYQLLIFVNFINMQKMRLFLRFALEKWLI